MKEQIRKGCFETNSSSTHAICIQKENLDTDNMPYEIEYFASITEDKEHPFEFKHGEFGWSQWYSSEVEDKAQYLYQCICDLCKIGERVKACKFIKKTLKKYGIVNCAFQKAPNDGYVDHIECMNTEWVKKCTSDEDFLMKYLFGKALIITGNDNSDGFEYLTNSLDSNEYDMWFKYN